MVRIKSAPWKCLITSFSIVMGVPVSELERWVGHDGGEKVNDHPEPACRRGFHPQELVYAAWKHGWTLTYFQRTPILGNYGGDNIEIDLNEQFLDIVSRSRGVLWGKGKKTQHAVAFNQGVIQDPDNGSKYEFTIQSCQARQFEPRELLAFYRRPNQTAQFENGSLPS